jgi:predicted nucleic acid-binding protein
VIVLDASAAIELLLNAPLAPRISGLVFRAGESLHAPHLIDIEVAQVLRRFARLGEIGSQRAEQALEDLADLPLARYPHSILLPAVWALRENATAYDAAYLVLAEALGATLVTCDTALGSIPGHRARVEVIR